MDKINFTTIPTDYVRFFLMDWNGNNITWSNNATVTNATWTTSSFSYIKQQLSWGASTTFTYSSFTYTNSYLFKNWEMIKNSWEVWSTALSWVNWNTYQWLIFFNRTLSESEEANLIAYVKKTIWPSIWQTHRINNNDFPLYSTLNLETGKVLEISKPKVWSNYINQVDWSSYSATNVTEWTSWLYTTMSFSSWWITWSSLSFSTAVCYEKVSWKWEFKLNPAYITSTWITSWTREIANINCWNRTLSTREIEEFKYWSKII